MNTASHDESKSLHVVGVGASAGGLEALRELVEHLGTRSVALVVVQHLSPTYDTMMDEILARHTDMAVALVTDGVEVEAGHIYLIPPGKEMIMSSGRLLLTERDETENPNLPIDTFCRSLAQELGDRAVAIVLSGTGRDGSRGIRAVHEAGGLTLAQTADSAMFDAMPRAAMDTGCVDLEMDPPKMGRAIARYAQVGTQAPEQLSPSEDSLHTILETLRHASGIDFRQYKVSTVLRRVHRRMALGGVEHVDHYAQRVASDPTEANALHRDLLVGVTRFFRDEGAWTLLTKHIDTMVSELDEEGDDLRVWVAGCASGPEAYSLAILFAEAFRKRDMEPRVKIFATDVHRQLLERASQGVYDDERLEGVPQELRRRWFHDRPGGATVAPELREMIVFAHHDVTQDPPFIRLDLLSCRNMLIYLRPGAQQRVLTLFHFALKTSGLLFLSPSESPGKLEDEFVSLDNRWSLYRKRRDVRLRAALRVPDAIRPHRTPIATETRNDVALRARERLLSRFAPPSVVINPLGEVEHTLVGGGRFLDAHDGKFSRRLLDMLHGSLRTAVSATTHRAWRLGASASYQDATIDLDGERRTLDVHVEPLAPSAGEQSSLVVSFVLQPLESTSGADAPSPPNSQLASDRVNALEDQLAVTEASLQAALEEMGTSNEELQATNEELIASNEELQSTNEELSSVNEELVTVNADHQEKIAELQGVTADLENLLSSTEVHVLFLDSELRIRRFTPLAGELFRIRRADVGRPISDFRHRLNSEVLVEEARKVLDTGEAQTLDLGELEAEGRYLVRILPYTLEGAIEGVVFTFVDVTLLRRAQRERERLTTVVAATPDFVGTANLSGEVLTVNEGGRRMLGYGPDDVLPESLSDYHPDWAAELLRDHAIPYALEHGSWLGDSALCDIDGGEIPVSQLILAHAANGSDERFISTIARDMTEVHEHARELEEADRRKDLFLATLSHELRNPLHAIQTAVQLLAAGGADLLDRTLPVLLRQGENLERLLEDLLDVSRITAGQVHLRLERVGLASHLRAAADQVRANHPEVNLELAVPEEIDLDADPTRLEQMVSNLLSNAVKYSPKGSPIRLEAVPHDGWIEVVVVDEGDGLRNEDLSHIFQPFVRQGTAQTAPGLGLGLALVRQLAELHGGAIDASSEGPGKGSRFTLRLPRFAPQAMTAPPVEVRPEQPTGGYRSILVIDDNRDATEMLSALLASRDFEVHVAGTLEEGWAALTQLSPDVALVDIGLPDGSGLDLARRLAGSGRRPALLVAVSGYGQEQDIAASAQAGFDRHIVKPLQVEELFHLLGAKL